MSRSTKLTDLAMCPNRGDRDLEQFGGHGTDIFLRHDYATTTAKRIPTHEVLPAPILIHAVKGNPNKYLVENVWYGNGYENDGMLKRLYILCFIHIVGIFMKILK